MTRTSGASLLEVTDVVAGYGRALVVRGVSMTVGDGQLLAILGGNGAGKSTLLKVLAGQLKPWSGDVRLNGESIAGHAPENLARRGLRLIPQGHQVFERMNVHENLEIGAYLRRGPDVQKDYERMYELFPRLQERRNALASSLSGGERALLCLARALMGRPTLILLDEPSAGLSPTMIREMFRRIKQVQQMGVTVALVEQNATQALTIADYVEVLRGGEIITSGTPDEMRQDRHVVEAYLGA